MTDAEKIETIKRLGGVKQWSCRHSGSEYSCRANQHSDCGYVWIVWVPA